MQYQYTDPPEDERMTPAEFRVVREWLGFSVEWLAAHLDVTTRTIRHWEAGKYPIPDGVRLEIERLEEQTEEFVGQVVDALMDVHDPVVVTYRNDDEYHAAHPETIFPASWHRRAIARAVRKVPDLQIVYREEDR